jgi:hypothetical protein
MLALHELSEYGENEPKDRSDAKKLNYLAPLSLYLV